MKYPENIEKKIKELEKQEQECYCKLGKIYFSVRKEEITEEKRTVIKQLEETIEICIQAREQIKNKTFCPVCLAEVPSNSIFCNMCGVKLDESIYNCIEEEKSSEKRVCSRCGGTLKEGQTFCMHCGKRYVDEKVLNKRETRKDVCPNCGKPVESGQTFCIYCGENLM